MLFENKKNEEFKKRQGEQNNNIDKKNNGLGEELKALFNKLTEKTEEMKNEQSFDRKEKLAEEIREINKRIRTIQEYVAAETTVEIAKKFIKKQEETTKLLELLKKTTKTTRIEEEKGDTVKLFLEKEEQLENVSDEWINKQREDLNRILEGFGFSEALAEETMYFLKESFKNEIRKIKTKDMISLKRGSIIDVKNIEEILKESKENKNNDGEIEKIMGEMGIEWLLEEDKIKELINFIDSFSKKDLFDLLIKKFQGQKITDKEKNLLHFFIVQDSEYQRGAKGGSFNWLTGKIKLPLLNPDSNILIHEFTHKCLYELLKKAGIKIREIDLNRNRKLSEQVMLKKKIILEVENEDKEKGQGWFFKAEEALNESLAYKMLTYYDFRKRPLLECYEDEISSGLFKEIYDSIDDATKEKSLEEFCKIAKDLYLSFAKKWDIDLTTADVEKAIQDLKKEIENSK